MHLLPVYKPLLHRQPAATHTRKIWSEVSVETLKDCFDTMVWDVFCVRTTGRTSTVLPAVLQITQTFV